MLATWVKTLCTLSCVLICSEYWTPETKRYKLKTKALYLSTAAWGCFAQIRLAKRSDHACVKWLNAHFSFFLSLVSTQKLNQSSHLWEREIGKSLHVVHGKFWCFEKGGVNNICSYRCNTVKVAVFKGAITAVVEWWILLSAAIRTKTSNIVFEIVARFIHICRRSDDHRFAVRTRILIKKQRASTSQITE